MERRIHPIDGFAHRRRGFTLVEALIASVVLAVCVMGVAATLAASSQQTQVMDESSIATMLGRQLMEEIASKPFPISGVTTNPGWPTSSDRSTYDDAADYDGYTDQTPITTLSGQQIDPGGTYTRSVAVTRRVNPSDTPGVGNFALVTVTVTEPCGKQAALSRLMANVTQSR